MASLLIFFLPRYSWLKIVNWNFPTSWCYVVDWTRKRGYSMPTGKGKDGVDIGRIAFTVLIGIFSSHWLICVCIHLSDPTQNPFHSWPQPSFPLTRSLTLRIAETLTAETVLKLTKLVQQAKRAKKLTITLSGIVKSPEKLGTLLKCRWG